MTAAQFQSILTSRLHDRAFTAILAQAVRERREHLGLGHLGLGHLGLGQAELAELAACSTRFVHTQEAGKPTVRIDKLLDVLRVPGLRLTVVAPGSDAAWRGSQP